jgi:hypothetical protein
VQLLSGHRLEEWLRGGWRNGPRFSERFEKAAVARRGLAARTMASVVIEPVRWGFELGESGAVGEAARFLEAAVSPAAQVSSAVDL